MEDLKLGNYLDRFTLKGKVAVVVGASEGIGRGLSLGLAGAGADVIVCSRREKKLQEVRSEIEKLGRRAEVFVLDVCRLKDIERLRDFIYNRFGKSDILVNNAGFTIDRMVYNVTDEEWDSIIKTNLYGTFYCTRAACRYMRKQGYGRIVNTSSHSGLGSMGQVSYSASKEGVVGLTRTVARDMGRYNVTCNAIRPVAGTRGIRELVEKKGLQEAWAKIWSEEEAAARVKKMLEENLPEDVANLVIYLASEPADNVNGCV